MKLLFCNIGWMRDYQGSGDEKPTRGGKYNDSNVGHEVCNFSDNQGFVYGHVQPTGQQIKLENLGAKPNDLFVKGITVVWTAGPPSGGTVVIGWYENATVYRHPASIPNPSALQQSNNVFNFRVSAKTENVTLLPVEQRGFLIPRRIKGGMGQSNVWYADKLESKEVVSRVVELIQQGNVQPLPDLDSAQFALEGAPRLIAHLKRERNATIVKTKKSQVLQQAGKLCCEVCSFDFAAFYGDVGNDFCEVHHLQQLSKADGEVITELNDLAVICSNCHRMIHRSNPMLTIENLIAKIKRKT